MHRCTKNHDHMLYYSWDMACGRCNCYFSFWAIFCPSPPNTPKNERLKKWKKKLEISSFNTSIPKIMIICFTFLRHMAHYRCNCYFSFWAIFCPFTPLTAQKLKVSINEKTTWGYHHFTHVYQNNIYLHISNICFMK